MKRWRGGWQEEGQPQRGAWFPDARLIRRCVVLCCVYVCVCAGGYGIEKVSACFDVLSPCVHMCFCVCETECTGCVQGQVGFC